MKLYYPFGLIALIGIPILILVYLIKSKYTEQTIASTYLWNKSETFLKKRRAIPKLVGILSLVLQILCTTIIAVTMSHPAFITRGSAKDIFIVLDGSASMNTISGTQTRFDKAKSTINDIIDDASNGSSYTLVLCSDTIDTVYEGVTNKEQAKLYTNNVMCGWTNADCSSAVKLAQRHFDDNKSSILYFISDKDYNVSDNVNLINLSDNVVNYAISDCKVVGVSNGIKCLASVASYGNDALLNVVVSVKNNNTDGYIRVGEVNITTQNGKTAPFEIETTIKTYSEVEFKITNPDGLMQDNVCVVCNPTKAQDRKVIIVSDYKNDEVSDDVNYLRAAISGAGDADVTVVTPDEYENKNVDGFGMYVFNGYAPKKQLPENATVWLVGVEASVDQSMISYSETVTPRDEKGPSSYYKAQYTTGSSTLEKQLRKGLTGIDVAIRSYCRYSLPRNYTKILTANGDGMISVGLNKNGNRQVVIAFQIKNSNLGLSADFLILVRNLVNYCFPAVIDDTQFNCGDIMNINVTPNCESIVAITPNNENIVLDTVGADYCQTQLKSVGVYTLKVKSKGSQNEYKAFCALPSEESYQNVATELQIVGQREYDYGDGTYDDLLVFFIIAALLVLADWGLYCYGEYLTR